ncbi:MAG: SDR family oxidoreductase [Candidatus Marinimicrobia bacterium]|nr:SDR family oxidoreductase [Candidatus Neomarinimicrobiota bacterium]
MDLGIKNKKALVTGASRGLGRAIADSLAKEGVQVAIVARNQGDINSFLDTHPGNHIGLAYDLVPEGNPQKMVAEMIDKFGHPDIVVHNVGGNLGFTDPLCGIEEWRQVYRFNLEIAVELNQMLIPQMRLNKWGRIVHISSIASLENQGTAPYCSIKAALNAYTRSLGRYVSPDGINISAVLPGAVFTEGGYWDMTSKERPEHVEKYLSERMAIQRFGSPEEIGNIVTFLCSQHASFIVGSAITVDGGQGRCFF